MTKQLRLLGCAALLALAACDNGSPIRSASDSLGVTSDNIPVRVFTDVRTGCDYLITGYHFYSISTTPRLDDNGAQVCDTAGMPVEPADAPVQP